MEIAIKIAGKVESSFKNALGQATKGLGSITKTVAAATAAAASAVGAIGIAAINTGREFEGAMSQVAATMLLDRTTAEGQKAFETLENAARECGANTAFSATEAAEALNYLALAGYDADKAATALPTVLKLAGAGAMELAAASDMVTDSMSALGIEATEANLTQFSDKLAQTASKSNTSVAQLGEAILTVGGTILGTSRQPFKLMRVPDENGLDKVEAMKHTYHKLNLDCLVVLGGNGTHKTANMLREEGLHVITLPKTIDNDLWGTDMTFGFQSAVDIATDTIDKIHTTATSHSRVFIIEVMGHKVGWVTLHAGIAGGADIIMLPEIPYDIDVVVDAINKRKAAGKKFTIIAVAEGAISKSDAKLSKKELKEKKAKQKYPSVAYEVAEKIQKRTDQEVRITVPGHTQRGGSPCPYDRVLATRLGAAAAEAILDGDFGYMLGVKKNDIVRVPLSEVAGKLKYVDPKSSIIEEAEMTGISFGVK